MTTDVKLDQEDGTYLYLEGRVVKARTSDFMLESPERRKTGTNPHRRALVHDEQDGLTINFAGDYPGGVTLNGVVAVTPHQAGKLKIASSIPALVVHGDISYEVGGIKVDGSATRIPVSLGEQLGKLTLQLSELTARLASLEARVG